MKIGSQPTLVAAALALSLAACGRDDDFRCMVPSYPFPKKPALLPAVEARHWYDTCLTDWAKHAAAIGISVGDSADAALAECNSIIDYIITAEKREDKATGEDDRAGIRFEGKDTALVNALSIKMAKCTEVIPFVMEPYDASK